MPHFSQVTEVDLRAMARKAAELYLDGRATPTDSVIKVASSFDRPLTSEHVQRVCEMAYREIFERSFRQSSGQDRVVNFDPPDAGKVASAVRAQQMSSFHDKLASSRGGETMNKTAAAPPVPQAPVPQNAFARAMSNYAQDRSYQVKEARHIVMSQRAELREAVRDLSARASSADGSEKIAFCELVDSLVREVRNGAPPLQAVTACLEFAKHAEVSDDILHGMAADLIGALRRHGVSLDNEKVASTDGLLANERHPLRGQAVKVAELRGFKIRAQFALEDLRKSTARVERELQDALYR